jgi:hypothetical protein
MKKLEMNQMENLNGGDNCLSAFIVYSSAWSYWAINPNNTSALLVGLTLAYAQYACNF